MVALALEKRRQFCISIRVVGLSKTFWEKGYKFLLRCGGLVGAPYLTFEWLLGWIFYPLAFVMGVPCGKTRLPDVHIQQSWNAFKRYYDGFRAQKLTFISQQCRPASGLCLGWCGWPWVWWGQACRCPGQDHFSFFVVLFFVIVFVLLWLVFSMMTDL